MKSKSHPCKHPKTARRELKSDPAKYVCVKCGATVTHEVRGKWISLTF